MTLKAKKITGYCLIVVIMLFSTHEGYDPMVSGQTMISGKIASNGDFDTARPDRDNILTSANREVVDLVYKYAGEYGVDSRLVLAIIRQESGFNHEATSERGAVGIMQLMPVTHTEISQEIELADAPSMAGNIRAGVYYFSRLLNLFNGYPGDDQIRFALAAYNAGPARIYDAQELAAYIGENPRSWSAIQNILPLLSKRYYSLHEAIWPEGHPKCGYFGSWRQTVAYVDNVMDTFERTSR